MDQLKISNMNNYRLLASAALFRGMYGEKLDQYDVLAEFIKATVTLRNLHSFDVTTCTAHLKDDFGFGVPEAVVRNCIRSKLKHEFQHVPRTQDWQRTPNFAPSPRLEEGFEDAKKAQEALSLQLIEHVEARCHRVLTEDEKSQLTDDFISHLKGAPRQNANFPYIGHFILSVEVDSDAKKTLEYTRQGLILFDGLQYSAENQGATLTTDLSIYIDTEVLFSAVGYHGELRKTLFNDFFNLVVEVNERAKRGGGKIHLRYFDETAREVTNYFEAAVAIAEKRALPEPNKQAMRSIVNGCRDGADVLTKRVRFFDQLERLRIKQDEERNYYDPPDYNIESQGSIENLSRELNCEHDRAAQVLKQFSRVNYLRKGLSKPYFEKSGAIQLSDRGLTRSAAFSKTVAELCGKTVPLASDLDYMTERLWFKLNKGFSSSDVPVAFDIVARTRVVLSAQLGSRVSEEYQRLLAEREQNPSSMSDEVMAQVRHELMAKVRQPEEVTGDTLDLAFLADDDFVAHTVAQHSALKLEAQQGREFKKNYNELKLQSEQQRNAYEARLLELEGSRKEAERIAEWRGARSRRRERNRPFVRRAYFMCSVAKSLYWIATILLGIGLAYLIKDSADTPLALLGFILAVGPLLFSCSVAVFCRQKFNALVYRRRKQYLVSRLTLIRGARLSVDATAVASRGLA